jgi:exopolysaccharide biosynthesis WecB/TagA/CpsF family protein
MSFAATPIAIDDLDVREFVALAARFDTQRYAFVVTPNVDHLIRYYDDATFRALYDEAAYVLLDSRFLSRLLKMTRGMELRPCPGSDVTEGLFSEVIASDDIVVLIGGSAAQACQLAQRYRLQRLRHFNPPMGFARDPEAIEACLGFIEAQSPFRFCFLAVGCPQQELLAQQLKARGRARGLALCIGASINFLTGIERRAPRWMQSAGLEWLYRVARDPGRLARRYLVRGPRIFALLQRFTFGRRRPEAAG